jgi:hypothetical protein
MCEWLKPWKPACAAKEGSDPAAKCSSLAVKPSSPRFAEAHDQCVTTPGCEFLGVKSKPKCGCRPGQPAGCGCSKYIEKLECEAHKDQCESTFAADACSTDGECWGTNECNNGCPPTIIGGCGFDDAACMAKCKKYPGHCGGIGHCAKPNQQCTGGGWSSFIFSGSNCCSWQGLYGMSSKAGEPATCQYSAALDVLGTAVEAVALTAVTMGVVPLLIDFAGLAAAEVEGGVVASEQAETALVANEVLDAAGEEGALSREQLDKMIQQWRETWGNPARYLPVFDEAELSEGARENLDSLVEKSQILGTIPEGSPVEVVEDFARPDMLDDNGFKIVQFDPADAPISESSFGDFGDQVADQMEFGFGENYDQQTRDSIFKVKGNDPGFLF